jgi:branched-chain amino acid transport system permease protein
VEFFIQIVVNGLSIGFLYALAALGFVMIFKSSSVLNFAHGELLAIGAFFFLVLSVSAKFPLVLSFVLTLVGCFALGFLIERFFLRPLIGEALIEVIMLTVGLAVMFKGLMLFAFGGNFFKYPSLLPEALALNWGMVHVPAAYVSSFIIGLVCLGVFGLFFKYSSQGIYMRSVADHQTAALSLGVHVRRVLALSWAIAAVVAAMSGIVLGFMHGVNVHEHHHRIARDLHRWIYLGIVGRGHPLHRPRGYFDDQTVWALRLGGDRTGVAGESVSSMVLLEEKKRRCAG